MVRETEKKLIKLRFEEDRSESGRKNDPIPGACVPGANRAHLYGLLGARTQA